MNELNTPEELLARCVALAEEKKARNVVSLSMAGLTLICDYFLLVTAANTRQAQSISDNIEMGLKEDGLQPLRIEGYRDSRWILIDLGSVVVHIFLAEEREFYDLEHLWGEAERRQY